MNIDKAKDYIRKNGHIGQEAQQRMLAELDQFVADAENREELSYPAFDNDMSKADMIEHLIEVHDLSGHTLRIHGGYSSLGPNTKATKDDLTRLHDKVHEAQDAGTGEIQCRISNSYNRESGNYEYTASFNLGGYPAPKVWHRHAAPVLTDEAVAAGVAARNGKKIPGLLTVQERKALSQVVDNDFNSLKQEMRAFAADTLSAKKDEINADWDEKEKSIPDFASKATDLYRKQRAEYAAKKAEFDAILRTMKEGHEDGLKAIMNDAQNKGVTLAEEQENYTDEHGMRKTRPVFKATVEGRKTAITEAEKENKSYLDRGLLTLEKQRLAAQRQVLLAGVPEGAAKTLLEELPSAKALMVEAYSDQPKQIESTTEQS